MPAVNTAEWLMAIDTHPETVDADLLVTTALANDDPAMWRAWTQRLWLTQQMIASGCSPFIGLSLDFEHTNPPQRRVNVAQPNAEQANDALQQRVAPGERLLVNPARDLPGRRGLNRAEKPPFDAFNSRRGGGAQR